MTQTETPDGERAKWRAQMEAHCEWLDAIGVSYIVDEHDDGSFTVTAPAHLQVAFLVGGGLEQACLTSPTSSDIII